MSYDLIIKRGFVRTISVALFVIHPVLIKCFDKYLKLGSAAANSAEDIGITVYMSL